MSKKLDKTSLNATLKEIAGAIFLTAIVITLWYNSSSYIDTHIFSETKGISDIEARGSFGDKFGAINALFSALAFAGIIYTIFLQRKELKLQRDELSDTREEFKVNRMTNIMFKQIDYLNQQINNAAFDSWSVLYEGPNEQISLAKLLREFDSIKKDIKNNLDNSEESYKLESNFNYLQEINSDKISSLIAQIHSSLNGFENLLINSKIDEHEKVQLKKLLKENLISDFYSFLKYRKEYLKTIKHLNSINQNNSDLDDFAVKEQNKIIQYILNYTGNLLSN